LNAISDAASAANMAAAAVKSAGLNVLINLKGLQDQSLGKSLADDIQSIAMRLRL
jgi:formiminotetrahydrofolate cyclodeaminase